MVYVANTARPVRAHLLPQAIMISFLYAILRSLGLRCPHCHRGRLMKNWFVVNETCGVCGYAFLKETGDFWGGMVFSYTYAGLVAMIVAGVLVAFEALSWSQRVYVAMACGVLSIVVLTRGQYEDYRPPTAAP
jgi:uncharacterized protein (DUF983 family)